MTLLRTALVIYTVASTSSGIKPRDMLTSPCPNTSWNSSPVILTPRPLKPQHCPFTPNPVTHSKNNQAPNPTNDSPLLDDAGKKRIQQVVGIFLYYAQAVDLTILMALSNIATQQSAPTKHTKRQVNQFLKYMWTPTTPSYDTAPWTWYSTSTLTRLINPWGSLLQEVPITTYWDHPSSACLPKYP